MPESGTGTFTWNRASKRRSNSSPVSSNGFYVTELMGFGVNIVTGDYSRGAAGLWIRNGELAFAVSEVTIAGNLKDMLMGLEAVGSDLEFRGLGGGAHAEDWRDDRWRQIKRQLREKKAAIPPAGDRGRGGCARRPGGISLSELCGESPAGAASAA